MKHFKSVIPTTQVTKVKTNKNVQTSVPYAKADQTTYYKVVDSSKYTEGQTYKPTGNETVLASYTQTGLAGPTIHSSGNRDVAGYKPVAATTDTTQLTTGILGKGVVGSKTCRTSRWSEPLLCETYF